MKIKTIGAMALISLLPAVATAGTFEEVQVQGFSFPLSPGQSVLPLWPFDDQDGARILERVRLEIDGTIGAMITAENDSVLPAPDLSITLSGFMTADGPGLATAMGFSGVFMTDGSISPSDGVEGSGPDFWDFGPVTKDNSDSAETTTNLDRFIGPVLGPDSIDITIFASGGFVAGGTTDSTMVISDFMAIGEARLIYEYSLAPTGACCFVDGSCQDLAEQPCATAGGESQGIGTDCATAACRQPEPPDTHRGSGSEKGSLVIFPHVELRYAPDGRLIQDTFLQLTNDFAQDVQVQMYFLNGDAPIDVWADPALGDGQWPPPSHESHPGWNWYDNAITLTGDQSVSWSSASGQPLGLSSFSILDPGTPPGRPDPMGSNDYVVRGTVFAWAVSRNGREIRWNHLAGNATIVNYAQNTAREYSTLAFQVVDPNVGNGDESGTPGQLRLDGVEYSQGSSKLLVNFNASGSTAMTGPALVIHDTELVLMPLSADLRQETDGPVTTKASFDVWNENEVKFSGAHRCVSCWDATLLSRYDVPNHFLAQNLGTNAGKARVNGLRSQLCDVDFDLSDSLPLGADPRDIVSEDAAIIGVVTRHLRIDGVPVTVTSHVIGTGYESALIEYDVIMPSEEANQPAAPAKKTARRGVRMNSDG